MIETNIKFISNWNLDGIPFKRKDIRIKLNKKREFNDLCSEHYMKKLNVDPYNNLIISCFQECWTVNNTFMIKYFSQEQENTFLDVIIIIIYYLIYPLLLLCDTEYNQPKIFQDQVSGILPYNFMSKGKNNKNKLVDSGLCILSNWKPVYTNFYRFSNENNIYSGEHIITRGVLLSIFIDNNDKVTTLLFNTQLSFDFYVQNQEVKELIKYIKDIKRRFNGTTYQEIFLVGDFKSKINEIHIQEMCKELNLLVITPYRKKNHMFYWRNDPFVNLNFIYSGDVKTPLSKYRWDSIILKRY